MEKKKGRKKLSVPGRGIETTTLTLKDKAPVCISTFELHEDPWLQLLYKYHEGYNSIAQYPMHLKERERESVIELNLKVQKSIKGTVSLDKQIYTSDLLALKSKLQKDSKQQYITMKNMIFLSFGKLCYHGNQL